MERKRWYKDKVFYQIWPRSFKDGDGDGMGDLWGVYEKLDYIKSLGCDGIWFSPIYPSPGADCGYDISNYRDIAPEFGGMEAFKKVLEGAHARDMNGSRKAAGASTPTPTTTSGVPESPAGSSPTTGIPSLRGKPGHLTRFGGNTICTCSP